MELHICHLYANLLNVYGDVGNIKILKRRAEKRDILVHVHNHAIGECLDENAHDIIMLGGGQDFEMHVVLDDLKDKKRESLKGYIENEGVFLAVGSGYQMLGESFVTAEGKEVLGLSLLPIRTKPSERRFVGNIITEVNGIRCVGFENHIGKTYIGDMLPLGHVSFGFGNNGEDGEEGLMYKNTFCTFMHGPFLSKNPEIADLILLKALRRKYDIEELTALDDSYEYCAKEHISRKFL